MTAVAYDLLALCENDEEDSMHVSVLLTEVIEALELRPGGTYVDMTLGAGGHTRAILEREPKAKVYAFDRDPVALAAAASTLAGVPGHVVLRQATFSEVPGLLAELGVGPVDGLMADLGVSSMQLDDPERGVSFRTEGPLDMRMDRTSGLTALELIEQLDQTELADLIYALGEERRSRSIARCIKQASDADELRNTRDLRRAVIRASGPRKVGGVDPATRTFQALRIAVNDELGQLKALLAAAPALLREGGLAAIISFHSLEDRLVKRAFLERELWVRLSKKPVIAGPDERASNPRSRSAKLRVARRLSAALWGEEAGEGEGFEEQDEEDLP